MLLASAIIITQTRTAYIALLIQIILMLILYPLVFSEQKGKYKKIARTTVPFITIVLVILFLVIYFAHDNIFVKRFLSTFSITVNPRWLLWRDSFDILKIYPFTGSGIAMFSNVFEDIYSKEFKMMDVTGIYDNAHNNFINILCTMGIIGLTAYLLLLYRVIHSGFKLLFSADAAERQKLFLIAFLTVISGYIVFSLADFDDISILLYLFVYISMLKIISSGTAGNVSFSPNLYGINKIPLAVRFSILLIFSVYFIYNVYNAFALFKADHYFKISGDYYTIGNYSAAFTELTKAIKLNPDCPEYRYKRTFVILNSAINDSSLSQRQRRDLLEDAEKEISAAREIHPSSKLCQAALCLILFEMGRSEEAEKVKYELLSRDSLSIDLRTNLARYYLRAKQVDKAREQVEVLNKYGPENVDAIITSAFYYFAIGDYKNVEQYCTHALRLDPGNLTAKQFLLNLKK